MKEMNVPESILTVTNHWEAGKGLESHSEARIRALELVLS